MCQQSSPEDFVDVYLVLKLQLHKEDLEDPREELIASWTEYFMDHGVGNEEVLYLERENPLDKSPSAHNSSLKAINSNQECEKYVEATPINGNGTPVKLRSS